MQACLKSELTVGAIIGNGIVWTLISIVTLGIGYFIFLYKINAYCMDHTVVKRFTA